MEKLYGYKMSHDDRFAPNPYHEELTLATCKPYLRLNADVDDWIAGRPSKSMKGGDSPIGQEKLVFICSRITDNFLSIYLSTH